MSATRAGNSAGHQIQRPMIATRSKDPVGRQIQRPMLATRSRDPSWPPDPETPAGHQTQRPQLATRSRDTSWPPDPETPAGHQIQRTQLVTRSKTLLATRSSDPQLRCHQIQIPSWQPDPKVACWPPDQETAAGNQIQRPKLANTRSFQSSNAVTLLRQIPLRHPVSFCLSHQLAKDYLFFYGPKTIYSDNLVVFLRRLGFAHRVLTLSPFHYA